MLTVKRLKKTLHYEPDTGEFYWLLTTGRRRKAGDKAGSTHRTLGYVVICIDTTHHYAHRLAWLYMTEHHPKEKIDHINGVKHDNRWVNLREASHRENITNAKLSDANKSGYKGVSWDAENNKWRASICANYKQIKIGRFSTKEEAYEAYCAAALKLHGKFARLK